MENCGVLVNFDRYKKHVYFLKGPERLWNLLDFLFSGYQELYFGDKPAEA
jgi:hypothetical protein